MRRGTGSGTAPPMHIPRRLRRLDTRAFGARLVPPSIIQFEDPPMMIHDAFLPHSAVGRALLYACAILSVHQTCAWCLNG